MKRLLIYALVGMILVLFAGCASSAGGAGGSGADANGGAGKSGAASGTTVLGKFTAEGLDGESYDETVLSGKKVTMVNLWAPWCGPCVREMTDLQKHNEKNADKGFQVIGVIAKQDLDWADEVVADTGVKYPVLIFEDSSSELFKAVIGHPEYINGIPFTFFVDETGKQIGPAYAGAYDWEQIVPELLGE